MGDTTMRHTGAVEAFQIEGEPSPLLPQQLQDGSAKRGKKSAREMVEELVSDAVANAVAEAVDRRFQSAKDKRWDELEKQYGSLSDLVGKLEGTMGVSAEHDAEAVAEIERENVLAVPEGDAPGVSEEVGGLAQSLAERVQALGRMPGLKDNEDARSMLLRHAKPDGIEDYAALLEDLLRLGGGALAVERSSPSSPASVVIPGGGSAPADLWQAYERRRRALRPGDIQGLTALKREFRQKGLDVF